MALDLSWSLKLPASIPCPDNIKNDQLFSSKSAISPENVYRLRRFRSHQFDIDREEHSLGRYARIPLPNYLNLVAWVFQDLQLEISSQYRLFRVSEIAQVIVYSKPDDFL